ncbi:SAM-dependent methyltransferase [Kineosphaera limosa]|nr:hypothetical protein [Kineosphaera limosa]NYD98886.1 SAM-dependent methyltransferase [Kineosphaera limosa]
MARQGYLSLLTGAGTRGLHADDAEMVAARERAQGAGVFAPVAAALTEALRAAEPTPGALVDLGGGTGYYAAACLDAPASEATVGLGLDLSRYAARRAARTHPRLASVVADAWGRLPLGNAVAGVVLCVFAPRNPSEFARVLAPGGVLAVVTPRPGHLAGLADEQGGLRVDPDKSDRLAQQLAGWSIASTATVEHPLTVTGDQAADLLLMGPAAWHVDRAALRERLSAGPAISTTLAVDVTIAHLTARPTTARPTVGADA